MSDYINFLKEVFREFGPVIARKMFGGYGLYHEGIMFGLIADEQLYLKSDKTIQHYFEVLALPQFEYDKGGKVVKMSYFLAPDEIFEDSEQAVLWARRCFEVAQRNYKPKNKKVKTT